MRSTTRDQDLDDLEQVLVGTFDNYEQVYWEETLGVPAALRHRRTTSIYRRVDLPAFGERVYYAHKWWDGDPTVAAYRNLYVIRRDPALDLPRLDLLTIPDPGRLDRALDDDSVLRTLDPAEMIRMAPECNTVWRREGDGFRVAMAGDCKLTSVSPTGEPLAMTVDTRIDAGEFSYLSYGRDAQGRILFGPTDLAPSRERRARWFDGRIVSAAGESRVRLHDQGGCCTVDATGGPLSLRLRQIRWPTPDRAPKLALIAMQGAQKELLVDAPAGTEPDIAFAAPHSTSIGLRTARFEACFENAHPDHRGERRW